MSSIRDRLQQLRSASPAEAARLVFRKAVYREVLMGRYEVAAGASQPPSRPLDLHIDFLEDPAFEEVLGTTPYLSAADVDRFKRQHSVCIVARDGDRIAASSWMTRGKVYVAELQRNVHVPEGEHFSCRSYVHEDYRGMSLLSHMIHAYSARLPAEDCIWGVVYPWNMASVRSLEKIGWRHTGEYWTRFVFGVKVPGERHLPARPQAVLSASA